MIKYISLLFLLLSSCSNYSVKIVNEVKIGMDKSDVLDILGSPIRIIERGEKHVWIYRFYVDNKKVLKEVQFKQVKVTYVGGQKTFKKIVNANGSSYSHNDLESYLKKEKKKEKEKPKAKQDTYSIEKEIMRDLKPEENDFKPVN